MRQKKNFINNQLKVYEMILLSKQQFLIKNRDDITEEEYDNTMQIIQEIIKSNIKLNKRQKEKRWANIDKTRKAELEYYHKNKEKINARRKELYYARKQPKQQTARQILLEYTELHKEEIKLFNMERKAKENYELKLINKIKKAEEKITTELEKEG